VLESGVLIQSVRAGPDGHKGDERMFAPWWMLALCHVGFRPEMNAFASTARPGTAPARTVLSGRRVASGRAAGDSGMRSG
jgi:hypothetical protein